MTEYSDPVGFRSSLMVSIAETRFPPPVSPRIIQFFSFFFSPPPITQRKTVPHLHESRSKGRHPAPLPLMARRRFAIHYSATPTLAFTVRRRLLLRRFLSLPLITAPPKATAPSLRNLSSPAPCFGPQMSRWTDFFSSRRSSPVNNPPLIPPFLLFSLSCKL